MAFTKVSKFLPHTARHAMGFDDLAFLSHGSAIATALDANGARAFHHSHSEFVGLESLGFDLSHDHSFAPLTATVGLPPAGETIQGSAGDDSIFGTDGSDFIVAGGGDDTVAGGSLNDRIDGGDGDDSLTGGSGDDNLTGDGGHDYLYGGSGNDRLDGGAGPDNLAGGSGNDQYFVDQYDQIAELPNDGTDTVFAASSYKLVAGASAEVLATIYQAGTTAISLTGNELDQTIRGNNGPNTLSGGGGSDTLYGFGGNDTYIVTSPGEHVREYSGGGSDTVRTPISYTLSPGNSVDEIVGTGKAYSTSVSFGTADLIGNEFGQVITGYADSISGAGGNDTLFGAHAAHLDGGLGQDVIDMTNAQYIDIRFDAVQDSTSSGRDKIINFNFNYSQSSDRLTFQNAFPTAVDQAITHGALNEGTFDSNLSSAISAGSLGAHHAILFVPDSGDLAAVGRGFLIVDYNGVAGYQSSQDFVVEFDHYSGTLNGSDFSF